MSKVEPIKDCSQTMADDSQVGEQTLKPEAQAQYTESGGGITGVIKLLYKTIIVAAIFVGGMLAATTAVQQPRIMSDLGTVQVTGLANKVGLNAVDAQVNALKQARAESIHAQISALQKELEALN